MGKTMVKERSGFRELLRSFFSADYDEEEIFEEATVEDEKAWKAALANSDKIMGEIDKQSKAGKKSGRKIVDTVEISEQKEQKQTVVKKQEKDEGMEIGE